MPWVFFPACGLSLVVVSEGTSSLECKGFLLLWLLLMLPWWLSDKESACNAGDPGSIPELGRSPGEGNGNPLQYSCLKNSMDREAWGGYSPWDHRESDTTERLHFPFSLSCIGEGNGNPLQCSCLENPRDRGAWWAAIFGVAQSMTGLKRLSSSSSSSLKKCFANIL